MNETVLHALSAIADPSTGAPLPDAGRIDGAELKDGVATVILKPAAGEEDSRSVVVVGPKREE